jgi:DNA-binding Lrp family transcriptional regulator
MKDFLPLGSGFWCARADIFIQNTYSLYSMKRAFVLLNIELDKDSQVESSLKEIDEVKELYPVYGVYDYVIKIEALSMSELKDIISFKIRRIEHVRSTLTMITIE